jgi:hypothetical protein
MPINFNPENLLPTPSNYATPEQLASMRSYAQQLTGQSNEPVRHPLQGIANMVRGFEGGLESGRADLMQRQALNGAAQLTNGLFGSDDQLAQPAGGGAPMGGAGVHSTGGGLVATTEQLESGGNPNAVTGSNRGAGQFGPKEERLYGITDANRSDPNVQASAIQREAAFNRKLLGGALGRDPQDWELYLAHQQGIGGATNHLTNPGGSAVQNMLNTAEGRGKGLGWARQAISGNIPDDVKAQVLKQYGSIDAIPSSAFNDIWRGKYTRAAGRVGGQIDDQSSGPAALQEPGQSSNPLADMQNVRAMSQQSGRQVAQSGEQPPVDHRVVYPPQVTQRAGAFLTNPWIPDFAKQDFMKRYFEPKTFVDQNGSEWLYTPNSPPQKVKQGYQPYSAFGLEGYRTFGPQGWQINLPNFNPQGAPPGVPQPQGAQGSPQEASKGIVPPAQGAAPQGAAPQIPPAQGSPPQGAQGGTQAPPQGGGPIRVPAPLEGGSQGPNYTLHPSLEPTAGFGVQFDPTKIRSFGEGVSMQQAQAAQLELQKKSAEKMAEAHVKPVADAIEEGSKAGQIRNTLGVIRDAYASGGSNMSGGPLGPALLKIRQVANQIFSSDNQVPPGLSESTIVQKMNLALSSQIVKEITSRGTQFEVALGMQNSPGLIIDNRSAIYMTNILDQIQWQKQQLGKLASKVRDPAEWAAIQQDFYDKNPIVSPFTGQPLNGAALKADLDQLGVKQQAAPNQQGAPNQPNASGTPSIPQKSIDMLRQNPKLRDTFEQHYKLPPGGADQYLIPTVPQSK